MHKCIHHHASWPSAPLHIRCTCLGRNGQGAGAALLNHEQLHHALQEHCRPSLMHMRWPAKPARVLANMLAPQLDLRGCAPALQLASAMPRGPLSGLQSSSHRLMLVVPCPADQLQRATERQEYAEAAHLLEAVQQLAGHFQSYVQIPKVCPCGRSCLSHVLIVGAAVPAVVSITLVLVVS